MIIMAFHATKNKKYVFKFDQTLFSFKIALIMKHFLLINRVGKTHLFGKKDEHLCPYFTLEASNFTRKKHCKLVLMEMFVKNIVLIMEVEKIFRFLKNCCKNIQINLRFCVNILKWIIDKSCNRMFLPKIFNMCPFLPKV